MNTIYRNINIDLHDQSNVEQRRNAYIIVRHKNPHGRTTWYRAIFYDDKGRVHKSPCYNCGNCGWARRSAQNWLYANIHCWCKMATVEQRVVDENGNTSHIFLRIEEIL